MALIEDQQIKTPKSGDESEDDSEILEESPCGRWLKRREEVQQRDIPGIDAAYLAMDTDEGVEVVWNEVYFSERKHFHVQEAKLRQVFDTLTLLDHPNIVKFHKYWVDKNLENPRVVFITEFMSSGSLKQFLKKTKHNVIRLPTQAWKRWCTQILSALSYLHSCMPPIIHGNLTCDTIFIQHNGLIKIGSVAPDAIHRYVKTFRDELINLHFSAPEIGGKSFSVTTPAVDIYSFGICALEMAALELSANGESSSTPIIEDGIVKTLDSVENELQKDFIRKCLSKNPLERPSARQLLFHPIIFEVHSLKLQTAHVIVSHGSYQPDQLTAAALRLHEAEIPPHTDGRPKTIWKLNEAQNLELEKFLEDVRNGIYPLIAFKPTHVPIIRALSPEMTDIGSRLPEPMETRRVVSMMCNIKPLQEESSPGLVMTLVLRLDDNMNRQLSCEVSGKDTPFGLAEELVKHGFINLGDREMVACLISDTLSRGHISPQPPLNGLLSH